MGRGQSEDKNHTYHWRLTPQSSIENLTDIEFVKLDCRVRTVGGETTFVWELREKDGRRQEEVEDTQDLPKVWILSRSLSNQKQDKGS